MGMLVDGVWTEAWYDTKATKGHFKRSEAQFRNWITADGSPGPSGRGGFDAELGRYHLYVSYACPWAHRTLIFRKLKQLEAHISLSVVDHFMGSEGWEFSNRDGAIPDPINGAERMWQVYTAADPKYSGRVTVPVLWDKKNATVVSNESSEIIRMFNSEFNTLTGDTQDFYPEHLRAEIDEINDDVYNNVNNGVYKSGFATTQEAYTQAATSLFASLDRLEERLGKQRYLVGNQLTEADWRLFTTLVRFDPVYVGHFKCNLKRLQDYPNLWNYTKELYQYPGVQDTVNMYHITQHYYGSHESVNPHRIVPIGPAVDFTAPHNRTGIELVA